MNRSLRPVGQPCSKQVVRQQFPLTRSMHSRTLPNLFAPTLSTSTRTRTENPTYESPEILGLLIADRQVRPAVVMKTSSTVFRFLLLGVIVTVFVVSCCNFPFPSVHGTKSLAYVEIGSQRSTSNDGPYVDWKSQQKFNEALKGACDHGGTYCITAKLDTGEVIYHYAPGGSEDCTHCDWKNIRMVKVTRSKAAGNIAAGEPVANDPNVMHRVQSPYPGDIIKVLDALK